MKFSASANPSPGEGCPAEHVPISTPSDVDEALNRIKPDLAFCSIYKLNLANGNFFTCARIFSASAADHGSSLFC